MNILRGIVVLLLIGWSAQAATGGDAIALFVWHDSPNDL